MLAAVRADVPMKPVLRSWIKNPLSVVAPIVGAPASRRPGDRSVTSVRETAVHALGLADADVRTRAGHLARTVSRAIPVVGLTAGAVFAASQLNHGWVPWDDGTLAQSAQRVLLGELPHRDFAELYTGGLSFLNAGVLWLTGGNLFWLRVPMFLLFLAYLPCVYLIARRFASPAVATLAALFAVAWGPPVYPAAMPSWYTLYLAVIGAYFLVRHHESGGRGWLFAAGLAGGLSICLQDHRRLVRAGGRGLPGVPRAGAERMPRKPRRRSAGRPATRLVFARRAGGSAPVRRRRCSQRSSGAAEAVNLLLPVVAVCVLAVMARACVATGTFSVGSCGAAAPFLAGVIAPSRPPRRPVPRHGVAR